jgi:hypothetical protein
VTGRLGIGTGSLLTVVLVAVFALPAPAQLTDLQPGRNFIGTAAFGTDRSEEVDVGDCDNDGDLDAIVANGGEGPRPNRIFINLGGLQGGTPGTFADESATRLAGAPNDNSRDNDFVDIDQDGDLDILSVNQGTFANGGEPNRFYQNLGGLQGGALGFYSEITDTAYGQLVGVPLAQQIFGGNEGPFRDFCCDCDFADLDDDGDLDMFHGSYGPAINGTRDARIFLNDGTGVFDELWPWANATADIRTHTLDLDLADLDGDYDLDIFLSSRDSQARIYVNNLYAPISSAPFQDVTKSVLIDPGITLSGSSNYEVEFGDVDGDGDFDAWLVSYSGLTDRLLRNDTALPGALVFAQMNAWIKGDPTVDEAEVDFGDFDGDGDLDSLMANFSGTNWLYQSGLAQGLDPDTQGLFHRTGGGGGSLAAGFLEMPTTLGGGTTLDADWGDMDGDGDLDVALCNEGTSAQNYYYENALGIPDTHAPSFHRVTDGLSPAGGQPVVIHAQVRDNAPLLLHSYYPARLVYSVDGGAPVSVPMAAQGGQQFRGVIPAQLGSVSYHVEVDDLANNTGVSATHAYAQGAPDPWTDLGSGLAGAGGVPALSGTGTLVPGSPGTLTLSGAAPSATAFVFLSFTSTPTPFKGGTLVPVPVALTLPVATNVAGVIPLSWAAWPDGLPPGTTLYLQYAVADVGAPVGAALSNALLGTTP